MAGVDDAKLHHGITEDQMPMVLEKLGITNHTPEDCRVSEVLHGVTGKPVLVDSHTAWVLDDDTTVAEGPWVRWRIEPGTRRRVLVGNPGKVTLLPWNERPG
jgi:hypothetical protein